MCDTEHDRPGLALELRQESLRLCLLLLGQLHGSLDDLFHSTNPVYLCSVLSPSEFWVKSTEPTMPTIFLLIVASFPNDAEEVFYLKPRLNTCLQGLCYAPNIRFPQISRKSLLKSGKF